MVLSASPQGITAPGSKARHEGKQLLCCASWLCSSRCTPTHKKGAATSSGLSEKLTDRPVSCYVAIPSMCISSARIVAQCRITGEIQDASILSCGAVPYKLHCGETNTPRHLRVLDSKATHSPPQMCSSGGYGLIAAGVRATSPARSFTH